jgi:hypothetical protein
MEKFLADVYYDSSHPAGYSRDYRQRPKREVLKMLREKMLESFWRARSCTA